jgi:hypothetical protein
MITSIPLTASEGCDGAFLVDPKQAGEPLVDLVDKIIPIRPNTLVFGTTEWDLSNAESTAFGGRVFLGFLEHARNHAGSP